MEKLRFDIIKNRWGYVAVALSKHGIRHLVLPRESKQAVFDELCAKTHGEEMLPDNKHPVFKKLQIQLDRYFKGQSVNFNLKLDYNIASVFQRQVWCVARTIPPGTTRSYGWIAEVIGDPNAKRAVGQALNANPLPILVPCHRVVAAKGKLGGFSGGADMKLKLQKLEGAILA
jgi:methylated-DNA-[protein]-cysteine S-methyltransferase